MVLLDIHSLGETHVRADSRAQEIENPERRYDTAVEFPSNGVSAAILDAVDVSFTCRLCRFDLCLRRLLRSLHLEQTQPALLLLEAVRFALLLFPCP